MSKTPARSPGHHPTIDCDLCGGPTYQLELGSIWCAAEDPHPGGHFVKRRAFERTPADQAAYEQRVPVKRAAPTAPIARPAPAKPKATDGFDTGYDGFVKGER